MRIIGIVKITTKGQQSMKTKKHLIKESYQNEAWMIFVANKAF